MKSRLVCTALLPCRWVVAWRYPARFPAARPLTCGHRRRRRSLHQRSSRRLPAALRRCIPAVLEVCHPTFIEDSVLRCIAQLRSIAGGPGKLSDLHPAGNALSSSLLRCNVPGARSDAKLECLFACREADFWLTCAPHEERLCTAPIANALVESTLAVASEDPTSGCLTPLRPRFLGRIGVQRRRLCSGVVDCGQRRRAG